MSYAMRLAKDSWRANQRMVKSRAAGLAGAASAGTAGAFGRLAMTSAGAVGIFGAAVGALSYNPVKNTMGSHIAQEFVKTAADAPFDAAMFGIGSLFGPWGSLLSIGASIGLSAVGMNPGSIAGRMMERAGDSYRRERGMAPKAITQNDMTMKATQQGLAMLGQSGRYSMLGQEANFMHN